MSFSFSQPITSSFLGPNELLDLERLRQAPQEAADIHANRLLEQQTSQRNISAFDMEQAGRLAGAVLDETAYPTPEARAAAWPTLIARARANGAILPHAPDTYPGDDVARATFRMAMPTKELFQLGQAGTAIPTPTFASGGGGGAIGGADTAPINAAGDSRTRKAGEGGPPAAGSPGDAVAQQVHDFWIKQGYSEHVVAGIMAGGPGSESDFTPTAGGDKVNGVATSYGLYQHHGERLANMQKYFGLSGTQMPSADQQNQYAYWEITQGPLKNVGEMLKTAKTPAEAAAIWTQYFGVPADKTEIGRRARGADRFLNRYAGQPGAPGASTAAGVVTGDPSRPDLAPPPPGGAPGAYPAMGAGIGAVVGRPAAVGGTPIPAGRPTGPPVITDQPAAGGNVVAGPPGAATVGQPLPPSPAVPGNVDAINAGIVRAGGLPATAPQAASVEPPPEPGWGSGVGSYGPQNALAPKPPAAPVVAQQPPAPAPAATPSPVAAAGASVPAPPPMDTNNLTRQDYADLDRARRAGMTGPQLTQEVQQRQVANLTRQHQYQADVRQAQLDAASAQHQTLEEQRQAEQLALSKKADARAEAEAAVKARQAADPIQGTDEKANADRTLFRLADKITAGTATADDRRLYAEAAQYYLKPQMQWISDPSDPTKSIMVPVAGQLPYSFPHPSFQPGQPAPETKPPSATKTDFKPLPENERKLLLDTSTRLDQLSEQRSTFKPDFAGFYTAALGEAANTAARNLPASPTAVARAEWWQNYQRMKLSVRQGISGQSLTASELAEFDKADINPGMASDRITANLTHQDRILRTAHERRVRSLAADRYSPDAIREAGGIDPTTAAEHPAGTSVPTPPTQPPPSGFKVIVP